MRTALFLKKKKRSIYKKKEMSANFKPREKNDKKSKKIEMSPTI